MHPAFRTFTAVALMAGCAMVFSAPLHTETVRVAGPTIVAFVPHVVKESRDEGVIEGVAHLGFAVQDALKCLRPRKVKVVFLYADIITLRKAGRTERVAAHELGQAVGAVLVEPGRKSEVVFSSEGPSTLQSLLPSAAARYWNSRACPS